MDISKKKRFQYNKWESLTSECWNHSEYTIKTIEQKS